MMLDLPPGVKKEGLLEGDICHFDFTDVNEMKAEMVFKPALQRFCSL